MVFVEPHGVVEPLSEIRLTPASLLVEPAKVRDGRLGEALGSCRVLGCIPKTEDSVGEMAVVPEATVGSHESLIIPVFQKLVQERVPVHSQRPADALHATKVGLAGPLYVEGHPVSDAAQEGDPRLVFV